MIELIMLLFFAYLPQILGVLLIGEVISFIVEHWVIILIVIVIIIIIACIIHFSDN